MKSFTLMLTLLVCVLTSQSQEENETIKTKMDEFSSKTGIITKFTNYNLEGIKSSYGVKVETRIRKVNSGSIVSYFYQIEKPGKYGSSTASIEYEDLLELLKALDSLIDEESEDILLNPDYLENKFITVDGFQLGYYVSKGKSIWYLKLERIGSNSTLFVKDAATIKLSFVAAKSMIETLKTN
ncbi:hypothetical protein [Winogradskyella sp. PE311]|uniref:hypothetical protein n=1 Tax=Winogradskyella sp. PE311 TaxID=3366943 RepID=UPI00397F3154